MSRDQLHTTAAYVPTAALGDVYGVRVSDAFRALWSRATQEYRPRSGERGKHTSLPYGLLADAITHTTGALATLHRHPDPYLMVLSDPVEIDTLTEIMATWETVRVNAGLEHTPGLAAELASATLEPIHLADLIQYDTKYGHVPTMPNWMWPVVTYQLTRHLAQRPLIDEHGGEHPLHLRAPSSQHRNTYPALLTWDTPLLGAPARLVNRRYAEWKKAYGSDPDAHHPTPDYTFEPDQLDRAMIRLTPRVLQMPGVTDHLILSVEVNTVQIAPEFRYARAIKSGWVRLDDDRPIIPVKVYRRYDRDTGEIQYRYGGHELFQQLERFPDFTDDAIRDGTHLRLRWRNKKNFGVGRGAGQGTYEVVAQHMRQVLEPLGSTMLSFTRHGSGRVPTATPNYKAADKNADADTTTPLSQSNARAALHAAPEGITRIVLLAATPHTLERMRAGLRDALSLPTGTELDTLTNTSTAYHPHDAPNIEILVRQHPDLEPALLRKGDPNAIRAAALPHLQGLTDDAARVGVLIETTSDYTRRDWRKDTTHADPKHVLLQALAQKHMASQFLANTDSGGKKGHDHAGTKAAQDLLRSLGIVPRDAIPQPTQKDALERPTIYVGVRAVHRTIDAPGAKRTRTLPTRNKQQPRKGYYLSLVAHHAGTYRMEGWNPTIGGSWTDLGTATIGFNKHRHDLQRDGVHRQLVRALGQLRDRNPSARIIVYVDTQDQIRSLLRLRDSDYHPGPNKGIFGKRIEVVRVRAQSAEVPHAAGAGPWLEAGIIDLDTTIPSNLIMLADLDPQPNAPIGYFFSASRHYASPGVQANAHRRHSRLAVGIKDMPHPWHSLTTTELLVWHAEPDTDVEELIKTSAMLRRYAPYWDGVTTLPAPLHMANAMVDDHPVCKVERDYQASEEAALEDEDGDDADAPDGDDEGGEEGENDQEDEDALAQAELERLNEEGSDDATPDDEDAGEHNPTAAPNSANQEGQGDRGLTPTPTNPSPAKPRQQRAQREEPTTPTAVQGTLFDP